MFETDRGLRKVDGVTQVDSVYDPTTGHFNTDIVTKNGAIYRAETRDGTVVFFEDAREII